MGKKTDRAAKLARSTTLIEPAPQAAFPLPTPSPAVLMGKPTQEHSFELKFAESSSFHSMLHEEQKRIIDYLIAYRKELPRRLLAEGEAGRFVVIKDHEAAHIWDTADDAFQAATLLIGTDQFAVYQIKQTDLDRLNWDENTKERRCPQ